MPEKKSITVETEIDAPIEKIWKCWTSPEDIKVWNNISDKWQNIRVQNDLRPGGRFLFVMALKDGSHQFDFEGTYETIKINELITYTLDDGRKSAVTFIPGTCTRLMETFQPENTQPFKLQKEFSQAILNSFRDYVLSMDKIVEINGE